jgi:hypothetical protein
MLLDHSTCYDVVSSLHQLLHARLIKPQAETLKQPKRSGRSGPPCPQQRQQRDLGRNPSNQDIDTEKSEVQVIVPFCCCSSWTGSYETLPPVGPFADKSNISRCLQLLLAFADRSNIRHCLMLLLLPQSP